MRLFILVNFNDKPIGPFESTIDDVARSEMQRMLIWMKYMVVKVRAGRQIGEMDEWDGWGDVETFTWRVLLILDCSRIGGASRMQPFVE